MKKYCILALTIVLTGTLLMGCGCTNRDMGTNTAPTVLPTNEEVYPTTRETTRPTTQTTTAPSTATNETIDRGNGALDNTTAGTDSTDNGASRMIPRNGSASGRSGAVG